MWSYVGKDCDTKLFIKLNDLAKQCKNEMNNNHFYDNEKSKL